MGKKLDTTSIHNDFDIYCRKPLAPRNKRERGPIKSDHTNTWLPTINALNPPDQKDLDKKCMTTKDLKVVIENPKGSYKSFEIEHDPTRKDYPLAGVTYPVDYGYIEGYKSEDDEDLDVFVGSGVLNGFMKVWRYDVPIETKFILSVTEQELEKIMNTFAPVIQERGVFKDEKEFTDMLSLYKR